MRSIISLVVGVILIGTGIVVYTVIGSAFTGVSSVMPSSMDGLQFWLQYGISGGLIGVGTIMTISGMLGFVRGTKQAKQTSHITQTGAPTEAAVTFVDKNYGLLVNNRPIYSIVEYAYQDDLGNEYANRIENVNTDSVIRNKIEVGSKIKIKYLPSDPSQSAVAAW